MTASCQSFSLFQTFFFCYHHSNLRLEVNSWFTSDVDVCWCRHVWFDLTETWRRNSSWFYWFRCFKNGSRHSDPSSPSISLNLIYGRLFVCLSFAEECHGNAAGNSCLLSHSLPVSLSLMTLHIITDDHSMFELSPPSRVVFYSLDWVDHFQEREFSRTAPEEVAPPPQITLDPRSADRHHISSLSSVSDTLRRWMVKNGKGVWERVQRKSAWTGSD